jgi:hypothetical protein
MMDNYLKDKKACAECGCQFEKKDKRCDVCGSTEFVDYDCNILLTPEQVKEQFPEIPQRGLWFEVIDFSEKEYSSSWGFYGFLNGQHVYSSGGAYSRISKAGDAAREWKVSEREKYFKRKNIELDAKIGKSMKKQTWGTGYMRQDT